MLDASINTSIAKYFITFVELAVGESMNPSKLRFQGASSIIRSDTQACKWWEVQWDHFNKDQKWNEYTFRPGAEVQQGHIFKDQRYNTKKEVLDQGQNSFFEYNAFCKWLLTRTMDGSTRCRVEGEINLNLNYICGWGMQQLFNKDGLSMMLVTKKLVLSEVSTKVAARPIKKSCSCFSATCCCRCLLSIPSPVWFQTEQLSIIWLNSNPKLAQMHPILSPNCL